MVRFFVFIFLFSLSVFSEDLHLYNKNDELKEQYIELLRDAKLNPGDRIYTSKDKYFIYEAELSEGQGGNSSKIYSVKKPGENKTYALRLPFTLNEKRQSIIKKYLDEYYGGHVLLKKQKVPIPVIKDYEKGKLILTEVVDHQMTFTDFIRNQANLLSPDEIEDANKALDHFARKIAMFREIGDFHGKQIVYNKHNKSWTLLDFDNDHILSEPKGVGTPFTIKLFDRIYQDSNYESVEEYEKLKSRISIYYKRIDNEIKKERQRLIDIEMTNIEKYLKTFIKSNNKQDLISFYSRGAEYPNIGYFNQQLFRHFYLNRDTFDSFNWSVNELIKTSDKIVKTLGGKVNFFSIALDQLDDPLEIDEFVRLYSEKFPEIYKNDKAVLSIQKFLRERLEKVRMSKECVDAIGVGLGI